MIDNRPYLRCLHGYGLCLWRLNRFDEAAAVFTRMLWMNPSDNQGARFNLNEVRAGTPWEDCAEK
jgi:tetratricopeptide (TPR) repeat protein